ncbi:MAG TPA: metallopeptidase TldD-related protein [Thermoanaerobaculia bacterium]|nr:metallopeptidase TldD-related protein [Thermoanaerobaculia bacterium]
MTDARLPGELERRAPGQWELYRKTADSRETVAAPDLRRDAWRREEGWAARWWTAGAPRFAAATSEERLAAALDDAERVSVEPSTPPEWPARKTAAPEASPVSPPPELFDELSRAVAAASRGEASLSALSLRHGVARERLVNAAGLDVSQDRRVLDGVASAVGRRGARAREARLPFRWTGEPDADALARRLADAATLPLSDRPSPFPSGQWLLDPAVGAALLAAMAPLFCADRPPRWVVRGQLASPELSVADDASADRVFDGEGVPVRRTLLVEEGALIGRLHDLTSARRAGARSTGHGARPSFRLPPQVGPARLFFETRTPATPAALLSAVTRGLFASALIAPPRVDLAADRYELEFTGISVVAGKAGGPVAGARSAGRLSDLLKRIRGVSTDTQFFPSPYLVGSPTLLVERASFE